MLTRKMKDSGIEWIGDIPEDWEVIRNKYIFNKKNIKVGDKHLEYQLLSLTKKGIVEKDIEVSGGKLPASFSTYQAVETNDIVLCLFDIDVSAVFSGVSKYEGMISSAYDVFSVNSNMSPDFYDYYFQLAGFNRSYIIYSKTLRKTINEDNFRSIFSIVPPLERQVKIARKLDQVVLKIENIINETQQSIKELKKYKQSLITEAVTKGLDPNVEMKDSGIEWIGKIPKHWLITRPNRITTIVRGNSGFQKVDMKNTGDYVAVQYGQVYKLNVLDEKYQLYVDGKFYKEDQVVQKGDTILVSTSETMEDLGHSCFYNRKDIGLLGGEQLCLKPNKKVLFDKFLYYATTYFNLELNQYATGLKVYRFKLDDLKKINMIVPSTIEEQRQIVSYLDEQTSRIDKLIENKTKVIEELESYKKSLIYEYVTGKKEV